MVACPVCAALAVALNGSIHFCCHPWALWQWALFMASMIMPALPMAFHDWINGITLLLDKHPGLWALLNAFIVGTAL